MEDKSMSKVNEYIALQIDQMPRLIWADIRQECRPIGEEGWFGDCFFHQKLKIVVKKYRDAKFSSKVNEQVTILIYLQKYSFSSKIVHHMLYDQQTLIGFTLTFYEGKIWQNLISQENSIFRKSPVARIKLVLQIAEQIKHIQKINVCHGDLHLQNVLIDVESGEQDVLNPRFTAQVIDFGNGFLMEQGVGMDKGLTGWTILIPPEVEFTYYKDYNPFGLNAYQLARNIFFIIFLDEFQTIKQKNYLPIYQLDKLAEGHPQYPKQLHTWLSELLHYDISRRNKALSQDMSNLLELTKKIYIDSISKQQTEKSH